MKTHRPPNQRMVAEPLSLPPEQEQLGSEQFNCHNSTVRQHSIWHDRSSSSISSTEVLPAIPGHMHAPSMHFNHQQHTRNDSANLQSPFATPTICSDLPAFTSTEFTVPQPTEPIQAIVITPQSTSINTFPLFKPVGTLAIGGPGPIVVNPNCSTGLTPFLQSTPTFPSNTFHSQPTSTKEVQKEFSSGQDHNSLATDQPIASSLSQETPFRRTHEEPLPTEANRVLTGVLKEEDRNEYVGQAKGNSANDQSDDSLMDVPGTEYIDCSLSDVQWTAEESAELLKVLDEAEKYKWNYMSDKLFMVIDKRIPPSACQRKFAEMFGFAECSTSLASSLNYIAFRTGYSAVNMPSVDNTRGPVHAP